MDLAELIARQQILAVLNRYARGVDRHDWPLVRGTYHADAHDDHGLYQGGVDGLLEFLVATAAKFVATTHLLGNHLAEVDGSRARCETNWLAWYRRIDRQGALRTIVQAVRYLDRFEQRQGCWAIAQRMVVLDWEQVFAAAPAAPVAASWQLGGHGQADPSFAFFAAAALSPATTSPSTSAPQP